MNTSSSFCRPSDIPLLTNSFLRVSPSPSASPVYVMSSCHTSNSKWCNIPLLKHKILTWFPNAGSVSARTVGAKNIASSSGCAISKQILLFLSFGKRERVTETVYSHDTMARKGSTKIVIHCMFARRIELMVEEGKGGRTGIGRDKCLVKPPCRFVQGNLTLSLALTK